MLLAQCLEYPGVLQAIARAVLQLVLLSDAVSGDLEGNVSIGSRPRPMSRLKTKIDLMRRGKPGASCLINPSLRGIPIRDRAWFPGIRLAARLTTCTGDASMPLGNHGHKGLGL